jgi:hypothetical protein
LIAIEGNFVVGDDAIIDNNFDFDFDFDERDERDEQYYYYYNELRFKKNVRLERKLKLAQILKVRNEIFHHKET